MCGHVTKFVPVASLPLLGPLREWVPSPVFSFPFHFLGTEDKVQGQWSHGIERASVCAGCSIVSDSLQPARILCPWNSPGKNIGVGCHSLLQGIFRTQGSNLGLLHCRQILYHLSHQGSPEIAWIFRSGELSCQPEHQLRAIK